MRTIIALSAVALLASHTQAYANGESELVQKFGDEKEDFSNMLVEALADAEEEIDHDYLN